MLSMRDGKPKRVKTMSGYPSSDKDKRPDVLRPRSLPRCCIPCSRNSLFDADTEILVNPSGRFVEAPQGGHGTYGQEADG